MYMALGQTHRRFNLITGVLFLGIVLVVSNADWESVGCFSIAYIFGTFILSPDIDLGPNKYSRWSKLFLYPYSLIFKHRGISHSIFLGTLTRILYGLILGHILIVIGQSFFEQERITEVYLSFLSHLFFDFNYDFWPHKWLLWMHAGLFCSDLSHVFLDSVTTKLKKLF